MLHPITSDKRNVVNAIQNALAAFKDPNNPVVEEKLREAFPDPAERDQARQKIQEGLTKALDGAEQSDTDPKWFTPRDPMAALAQSAMNNRAMDGGALAATAGSGPARAAALAAAPFEQFGITDPGWIECVIDGFHTLLHGKAAFIQHQSLSDFLFTIDDQTTIAIVGDWGAHNDAAKAVAAQITARHPNIVIHLGDIYYAGQRNEAESALSMWPLADLTGAIPAHTSFALNGNHEMFSGGRPYFETVLPKLGQPASYFGFRNNHWQILAFDSAYVEHRLLPPDDNEDTRLHSQWNWLVDKMRNSKLPTILLSHHEPVSAFAQEHSDGTKLRSDFQKFIAAAGRDIFGWFFGHEHRCTIYDDPNIPYFARLIGNGCIPHTAPPAGQKPEPGCESFSNMNFKKNADGDAMSGFALLKFDNGQIDIQYINEDGSLFMEETWVAPPPD